jgi:uncharacterized protein YdhG (YjbR/CyaY superfamily)
MLMKTGRKSPTTIDQYIAGYPREVEAVLRKLRQTIRKAAPEAGEAIKYGIPTFTLNGNLVHFGGFKNHVSFFPTSKGIEQFKKELSAYEGSKGTVRFPLDKPIPYGLISRIVKFRVKSNLQKSLLKGRTTMKRRVR